MSASDDQGAGGRQQTGAAPAGEKRLKRFYDKVSIAQAEGGWAVLLDGKPVRTPLRLPLLLPAAPLCEAAAGEWREQGTEITPHDMLLNRLANTAIDGVRGREAVVIGDILAFAASDLICYRAATPAALRARQSEVWDPVLRWLEAGIGAAFSVTAGVMPVRQPAGAIAPLHGVLGRLDAFALTALHAMTTLTGSALLTVAHLHDVLDLNAVWAAAHIDEDWQNSQWGIDAQAAIRRKRRFAEMQAASRFLQLSRH